MDLQKNNIKEVTIDAYASDGSGVARIDGFVVFVKGALRGETCLVRILKVLKNTAYAKIEKVLVTSPHRAEPVCPVFGKCGGCDFMHMDYEEELALKRERVQDALTRLGGSDIRVSAIHGADEIYGYRNKAIYGVSDSGGRIITGFYRGRSHDVTEVGECAIQADFSARAVAAVREWMEEYGVPAYDEKSRIGSIRHVFCRYAFGTAGGQVAVVSAVKDIPEADALVRKIREKCPETRGILLNVNKSAGNTVLAGDFYTLYGDERLEDTLCGNAFRLSPQSFYQINRAQAERLYELALDMAGLCGKETVLELYCGAGTITLCLATRAKRVIGAEIVPQAVENARANAERNCVKNVEFICADAADTAKKFAAEGLKPDVVVVDPPRKGLAQGAPSAIASMSPERIVYVSCDPATLARDVKIFASLGYALSRADAVDMFPRCAHVETVVKMIRQ